MWFRRPENLTNAWGGGTSCPRSSKRTQRRRRGLIHHLMSQSSFGGYPVATSTSAADTFRNACKGPNRADRDTLLQGIETFPIPSSFRSMQAPIASDKVLKLRAAAAELQTSASRTGQANYVDMFLRAADSLNQQADWIAVADTLGIARTAAGFGVLGR